MFKKMFKKKPKMKKKPTQNPLMRTVKLTREGALRQAYFLIWPNVIAIISNSAVYESQKQYVIMYIVV